MRALIAFLVTAVAIISQDVQPSLAATPPAPVSIMQAGVDPIVPEISQVNVPSWCTGCIADRFVQSRTSSPWVQRYPGINNRIEYGWQDADGPRPTFTVPTWDGRIVGLYAFIEMPDTSPTPMWADGLLRETFWATGTWPDYVNSSRTYRDVHRIVVEVTPHKR